MIRGQTLYFRRKKKCEREGGVESEEETDSEEEDCQHLTSRDIQPVFSPFIGQLSLSGEQNMNK